MIKCVVPVSGGKDSQACLKLAAAHFGSDNCIGLFCDTQFEHPITYAHIANLQKLYGVEIRTVTGGSVLEKSLKYKRFPGGGARHCTDELKIRETKLFCKSLAEQQGGFEVWYGMRSDESAQRKKRYAGKIDTELYQPHEVIPKKYPKYLGKMGVRFRLPVLDWTKDEIFKFLADEENPLYRVLDEDGKPVFDRVGCFPCLASGDGPKRRAFEFDDFGRQQLKEVQKVEKIIGRTVWIKQEFPPCSVCSS